MYVVRLHAAKSARGTPRPKPRRAFAGARAERFTVIVPFCDALIECDTDARSGRLLVKTSVPGAGVTVSGFPAAMVVTMRTLKLTEPLSVPRSKMSMHLLPA